MRSARRLLRSVSRRLESREISALACACFARWMRRYIRVEFICHVTEFS